MKTIPDGICLSYGVRGERFRVFNPRWWRVDRWLFWAWLVLARRRRGRVEFTSIVGGRIDRFELPVYESA